MGLVLKVSASSVKGSVSYAEVAQIMRLRNCLVVEVNDVTMRYWWEIGASCSGYLDTAATLEL